jgi:hypothetical protein
MMMTVLLLAALPAVAQDDKTDVFVTTYDPATSAHYRVAHFVPDAGPVDVLVNGELGAVKALGYPEVSDWITVPAGAQALTIVPTGEEEDAALLEPVGLNMAPMGFYTVVLMGNVSDGTLQAQVLEPDTTALTPGTTRVTFLQAIDKGDNVGFYRDEVPFTTGFNVGDVYTEVVDSGTHMFQAVTGGDNPVVLAEQADVELRENRTYIIASVGQAGTSGDTEPQFVVIETPFANYLMGSGELAQPGTIVQAIQTTDLTGDLSDALVAANLVDVLEGEGPFTLFAPAELRLDDLASKDPATLEAILSAHVVEGEYLSQDLAQGVTLTSLAGTPIMVDVVNNGFSVNGVPILTVNIPASNGVVHLIGGLLDAPAANG